MTKMNKKLTALIMAALILTAATFAGDFVLVKDWDYCVDWGYTDIPELSYRTWDNDVEASYIFDIYNDNENLYMIDATIDGGNEWHEDDTFMLYTLGKSFYIKRFIYEDKLYTTLSTLSSNGQDITRITWKEK